MMALPSWPVVNQWPCSNSPSRKEAPRGLSNRRRHSPGSPHTRPAIMSKSVILHLLELIHILWALHQVLTVRRAWGGVKQEYGEDISRAVEPGLDLLLCSTVTSELSSGRLDALRRLPDPLCPVCNPRQPKKSFPHVSGSTSCPTLPSRTIWR